MAAVPDYREQTTYDPAARKRSQRRLRGRGVWVYIPGVELKAAGFDLDRDGPPWYRLAGHKRSPRAGSVIVSLYREP